MSYRRIDLGLGVYSFSTDYSVSSFNFEDEFVATETVEVNNVVLDFDESGRLVGLEFLTDDVVPRPLLDCRD